MSAGNWGGSAAGGGLEFQSAVSAICLVHMACGTPLCWSDHPNDTPLCVAAETGGAGDDIALQLSDGSVVEIQAKRKLAANNELWNSLLALSRRAQEDSRFHGILVVGPGTSGLIRDQLARDLVRIGQGRLDDLSANGTTFLTRLAASGLSQDVCARIRIHTAHVLEHDAASKQAALAKLVHVTSQPAQAWDRLVLEGLRLIRLRGRHDASSLVAIVPALTEKTGGVLAPAMAAGQFLEWTLKATETFTIPAVKRDFSMDTDWLELKATKIDQDTIRATSMEEALTHYRDGRPRAGGRRDRKQFDAETLGYFHRHCVVVAGPGMGKTQLLRRMARLLARKGEPALIVRLRTLSERLRSGETFLEAVLHIGTDTSPLTPEDVKALGMQNLTLMLDGLDESGGEQDEIAKAAVNLIATFPRCRIVFATRPIGYETALLGTWSHYEIDTFDSFDPGQGVTRLITAAGMTGDPEVAQARDAATGHLARARDDKFSARTPLLVAFLASLALNKISAAESREGLYEQLFKLIERMAPSKHARATASSSILNAFLHLLGWELTARPYASVDATLAACASQLAVDLDERPLKVRGLCDEALAFWERAGIVERVRFKGHEALAFIHKTFGEYAGARFLLSRDTTEQTRVLSEITPLQQWNEVAVFAAASGMGSDIVRVALAHLAGADDKEAQLLRWAQCSLHRIDADLSEQVLARAFTLVEQPHSLRALRSGRSLLGAVHKLPGADAYADRCRRHPQWWTALIGWACYVLTSAERLDFTELMSFMDSYETEYEAYRAGSGFDLNNPVPRICEPLLIAATQEAVRRGMGDETRKFVNRVTDTLESRSSNCFFEISSLLEQAGIEVKLNKFRDPLAGLDADFFEKSRNRMLTLMEAIGGNFAEQALPAAPPFLHLSAFLEGSGYMDLSLPDAALAASAAGSAEAREIVEIAARASAENYPQLVAEAHAKQKVLRSPEGLHRTFEGLATVDVSMSYGLARTADPKALLTKGLLHSADWIVFLSVNLAKHLLTAEEVEDVLPGILLAAEGIGATAGAHLGMHFLGKDRTRDLIVARLREPLNSGCQHLYSFLATIWTPDLEQRIVELLTPALCFGPRTAQAALEVARACDATHRKALAPLLREAYDHWLQNEAPYPNGKGVVPESPRGEILQMGLEQGIFSPEDLFLAVTDRRDGVSKPAREALVSEISKSEALRSSLVQRLLAGESLDNLLAACLRALVPFSESEVRSIAGLLGSASRATRQAATGVLELHYLPIDTILQLSDRLTSDLDQRLRDKGHERLATLRRRPRPETPAPPP